VVLRDAGGPGIEVLALAEGRRLGRAVDFRFRGPAANGPVTTTRSLPRFENLAGIACLLELLCRCEAGDSGAKDHYPGAVGPTLEREVRLAGRLEGLAVFVRRSDEPEGLHRAEHRGRTAGSSDRLEEPPTGNASPGAGRRSALGGLAISR
jgi:hypothetical protein